MFNIKLDEKSYKIGSDRFKMDYQRTRNVSIKPKSHLQKCCEILSGNKSFKRVL